MGSVIDLHTRISRDLTPRQRGQVTKLLNATAAANRAQAHLDSTIATRNQLIVQSLDEFELDIRTVLAPATGLTHTRINQILAKEET